MTSPSQAILRAASTEIEVVDAAGRHILVRNLNALDKPRMFKAVGAELAQNTPYLGMAMLAWSVTAIDSVPVPLPTSEAQIEALVSRLGDDGLDAVARIFETPPSPDELRQDAGN
jgi:hypothetical protein